MVIRSSSAREVQQLTADLRHADALRRDAAIARLRVLGSRAIEKLSAIAADDASATARASALKALEGVDDPRVPAIALRGLADTDVDVRLAAVGALSPWVVREEGTGIMDALVEATLDRDQAAAVRLAALDALSQLPRDIVQPVVEHSHVDSTEPHASDDPARVQEWVGHHGDAPLSSLHHLIVRVREHEQREPHPTRRREWLVVRGAIHAVLARRRSRVALYDLREAFDAAVGPLPLDFLTAAGAVGDATCLEPMARAWATSAVDETWWRARLSETAAAIVKDQRLTGRNPVIKRIRGRWPGFL